MEEAEARSIATIMQTRSKTAALGLQAASTAAQRPAGWSVAENILRSSTDSSRSGSTSPKQPAMSAPVSRLDGEERVRQLLPALEDGTLDMEAFLDPTRRQGNREGEESPGHQDDVEGAREGLQRLSLDAPAGGRSPAPSFEDENRRRI